MPESNKPPRQESLASFETDQFGALFAFYEKVMTLLRQSSLDDQKLTMVADLIKTLLYNAAEVKGMQQMDVTKPLETAYEEIKRLVDELSGLPDGGKEG